MYYYSTVLCSFTQTASLEDQKANQLDIVKLVSECDYAAHTLEFDEIYTSKSGWEPRHKIYDSK